MPEKEKIKITVVTPALYQLFGNFRKKLPWKPIMNLSSEKTSFIF
jgi:hypothetical protein